MNHAPSSSLLDAHIRAFNPRNIRRIDPVLGFCVLLLALVGILVLYSANRSGTTTTPFYLKQAVFFGGGCAVALFIACFDHRFLVSLAPMFYVAALGSLIAVLIAGAEFKGGRRWFLVGPVHLQPSEFAKLAVIFTLAWYFSMVGRKIEKLPYFLLTFAIVGLPAILVFKQPDLGTAATLGPIALAMLYVAGCKRWHLVSTALMGIAAVPLAWSQMADYQRTRVMTIINPGADAQGSGYHTIQSMITVGSGGLTGKGYMEGTQTYLSYLPEHHTDFIFSLLAEEFGFVGGVTVLIVFLLLFLRGLHLAGHSTDMAGSLLVVGVVALLSFHVFANIAITIGIMPVTGLPLPFLSYGGSFYLTTMSCIGVLFSVNARRGMFDYIDRTGKLSFGYSA